MREIIIMRLTVQEPALDYAVIEKGIKSLSKGDVDVYLGYT